MAEEGDGTELPNGDIKPKPSNQPDEDAEGITQEERPTTLSSPWSLTQIGALFCGVCIPNIFCTLPRSQILESPPSQLGFLLFGLLKKPPTALYLPLLRGQMYPLYYDVDGNMLFLPQASDVYRTENKVQVSVRCHLKSGYR